MLAIWLVLYYCNTATYYFLRLRKIIAVQCKLEADEVFGGEVEVDELFLAARIASLLARDNAMN